MRVPWAGNASPATTAEPPLGDSGAVDPALLVSVLVSMAMGVLLVAGAKARYIALITVLSIATGLTVVMAS